MEKNKKDKLIEGGVSVASEVASTATGTIIGGVVGGPIGAIVGSVAGATFGAAITAIGQDIKERILSKAESRKINTVFSTAVAQINEYLKQGKQVRDDAFFESKINVYYGYFRTFAWKI